MAICFSPSRAQFLLVRSLLVIVLLFLSPQASEAAAGSIEIRTAVELELTTQAGVSYALQSTTNLVDWLTEEVLMGGAVAVQRFRSISTNSHRQFRLAAMPSVSGTIQNQTLNLGEALLYAFGTDVFTDPVGGALTYRASLPNGDPLPGWLTFNPTTRTFSGTPSESDGSSFTVQVFARNQVGLEASVSFSITAKGSTPSGYVLIPAGSFEMGDHFNEGFSDERPAHTVSVSAFYMKTTEVTKSEWDEVADWASKNGYDISEFDGVSDGPDHPINYISWSHCAKYSNAKSQMEGLTPVYTVNGVVFKAGTNAPTINFEANGYRLPTEAEWEKAARGGQSGLRFPWGNTITHTNATYYSTSLHVYDVSATRDMHPVYGFGTSPVASFAPNGYGLYDMTGNVWEWCSDWASTEYYANSPANDPTGPPTSTERSIRGGAFAVNANLNRIAYRSSYLPNLESAYTGFRLARKFVN